MTKLAAARAAAGAARFLAFLGSLLFLHVAARRGCAAIAAAARSTVAAIAASAIVAGAVGAASATRHNLRSGGSGRRGGAEEGRRERYCQHETGKNGFKHCFSCCFGLGALLQGVLE